jgi:hypothetical protein
MTSLLEQHGNICDRFQDWLEESSDSRAPLTALESFLATAPADLREHAQLCSDCHDAAADIVALRLLLQDLGPATEAGPWFAPRVINAIVARESQLSRAVSIWLAVPKFASRLTWIAATLLLVSGAWLYERPASVSPQQSASAFASEHLFDPPSLPASNDDVLVSRNEKNQ